MKKLAVFFLIVVLVALVSVASAAAWVLQSVSTPRFHDSANMSVEIERGASFEEVLEKLKQHGIIESPQLLKVYVKVARVSVNVQAGAYTFDSPVTPLQVLNTLAKGAESQRITIIEGWTRWDIANAIASVKTFRVKSQKDALSLLEDVSLIKDLDPAAKSLEGYLFPDTYFILGTMKPAELVAGMVSRFREVFHDVQPEDTVRKRSIHDVVTIASIIETEAKLKEERPIVASVIYNRLHLGMPLAMDSTIVYASKLEGKWRNDGRVYKSDVERRSPYNTRIFPGLPPGPVGAPGRSSLEAAVRPAKTSFLYYVRNPARNDGAHNFYADVGSFEKGVQALRNWEKNRDAANKRP